MNGCCKMEEAKVVSFPTMVFAAGPGAMAAGVATFAEKFPGRVAEMVRYNAAVFGMCPNEMGVEFRVHEPRGACKASCTEEPMPMKFGAERGYT